MSRSPRKGSSSRKKGGGAKPAAKAEPRQTAEQMDDDQLAALTFQHKTAYERLLAAKKKGDADFKNGCKLAKAELGPTAIDDIKQLIELEAEDGEKKISERVQRILRVSRWGGHEIQLEMFGERRGRAFDLGKTAGFKGEPAKPPFAASTDDYNAWLEGHRVGNNALARKTFKTPGEAQAGAGDDDVREGGADDPEGGDDSQSGERIPRSEWQKRLRAQNEEVSRGVKAAATGQIGDRPSSATVTEPASTH